MLIDGIFSDTVAILGNSIDLRAKNHNFIASNIANAETPNFTPKTLMFEQELQEVIKNSQSGRRPTSVPHARHISLRGGSNTLQPAVAGRVVETPAITPSKDGNAVELEDEMAKMAENQIKYNASVQLLSKKFEGLRTAIREGK